jgi:DNA/RNA endonuclease YhcR with UshA esterase domain
MKFPKINLLQLSLVISLLGIFILIIFASTINPKQITIKEINNQLLNKQVKVSGQITNLRTFEESNFQLIDIKDDTGKITITTDKIINISKDQNLQIIGKVTEYNHTLQIQASKIFNVS